MTSLLPELHRAFDRDGFVIVKRVLDACDCDAIGARLTLPQRLSAGTRALMAQPWCAELAIRLRTDPRLSELIPAEHAAVQCIYFEKSTSRNWLVPMHQDLSIPVAERIDHPELHGWSHKEGTPHVLAPICLLEQLVVVRVHLDDCLADDGPLRVVPGSHRSGADASRPAVECIARRGDVLVMRPLLLHASSRASGRSARRVLHFLHGPAMLPLGLRWPSVVGPGLSPGLRHPTRSPGGNPGSPTPRTIKAP